MIVCGRGNLCTMHCVPQNCDCGALASPIAHFAGARSSPFVFCARSARFARALLAVVETHVEKAAWDSLAR